MSASDRVVENETELESAALEKARALARAIGRAAAFKAFEAAQEALLADEEVTRKLQTYQTRQREVQLARMWSGDDPAQESALEAEWGALAQMPTLRAYLQAQEGLTGLVREVVEIINQEVGVDYGAACAPAGGCC